MSSKRTNSDDLSMRPSKKASLASLVAPGSASQVSAIGASAFPETSKSDVVQTVQCDQAVRQRLLGNVDHIEEDEEDVEKWLERKFGIVIKKRSDETSEFEYSDNDKDSESESAEPHSEDEHEDSFVIANSSIDDEATEDSILIEKNEAGEYVDKNESDDDGRLLKEIQPSAIGVGATAPDSNSIPIAATSEASLDTGLVVAADTTTTHGLISSGQGEATFIVGDGAIYGGDEGFKLPRLNRIQTCVARLEKAATGEIGAMLWAKKFLVRGAESGPYTLVRAGWVKKGRCLNRIMNHLLLERYVRVDVSWYRVYFWQKWNTSGYQGYINWKSYGDAQHDTEAFVHYSDAEEDEETE
ncbi:hypothetical protein BJ508DRAFT_333370 [Ascobolus immersus RN42]|uniref:Uncharacterized protein n=1 Tax=Ascobolus immersus RN42 TaxID=1160509 RepID=A0A3N4HNQ9_ASCIM|nr:hypothetical protein BJ508DRAFT_333370 [Ascobolus immersus RN42]